MTMVTYCILTGLLVYYIALWLWYRHADNRRFEKGTNDKTVPESLADGYTLIGESRYKGGLIGTVPQAAENDTIFVAQAAGQPDETPDYGDDEPDYEDEEISGYMDGYDDTGRAAGVSFEELGETVRTVNADNSTEAEQRQAAVMLARIEGTNLYDAVVENINGGLAKVAELLGRNEAHQRRAGKGGGTAGTQRSGTGCGCSRRNWQYQRGIRSVRHERVSVT